MIDREMLKDFLSTSRLSVVAIIFFITILPTISSLAEDVKSWERQRSEYRTVWLEFLGPMASVRSIGKVYPPPTLDILEETEVDGFRRRKIRYESEKGRKTYAYLLIPKGVTKPVPGVVVFHATTKESYRQGAGVDTVTEKSFGYHLTRRGYVVICPQCYIWDDDRPKAGYKQLAVEFRERNPASRGMARMLLDGQTATDILVSLPEVDATRIGCVGHSLGAKEALYLPAFDDRIVCSVSSEGGVGIEQSNWDAEWYLGPDVKKPEFPRSHRELVAVIAPRPFLLLGGDASDGEASRPYIDTATEVYRLYGSEKKIELFNHRKGHTLPPEAERRIYDWFEKFLPVR